MAFGRRYNLLSNVKWVMGAILLPVVALLGFTLRETSVQKLIRTLREKHGESPVALFDFNFKKVNSARLLSGTVAISTGVDGEVKQANCRIFTMKLPSDLQKYVYIFFNHAQQIRVGCGYYVDEPQFPHEIGRLADSPAITYDDGASKLKGWFISDAKDKAVQSIAEQILGRIEKRELFIGPISILKKDPTRSSRDHQNTVRFTPETKDG